MSFVRLAAAALLLPLCALAASPEQALSGVVQAIESNRLDLALQRVEKLIAEHPNFRLAHLIRGDLLLARAQPLQTFGNVVKTTIFLMDLGDFQAVNGVYAQYMSEPYPARSTIQVAGLPMGARVEIEMIAYAGK